MARNETNMEKLQVTLYYAGSASEAFLDGYEMERLINWYTIELPRIPNVGEVFTIVIDDYNIEGRVSMVFTSYCKPGNPHIKESGWGCSFGVSLSELAVVDYYGKKK